MLTFYVHTHYNVTSFGGWDDVTGQTNNIFMSGLRICLHRLSRVSLQQVHKKVAASTIRLPIAPITTSASVHFTPSPALPAPGMAFVKKMFKGKDKKSEPGELDHRHSVSMVRSELDLVCC